MRNAIFFGLWLVYYLLFWHEDLALNLVVFVLLVLLATKLIRQQWSFTRAEWPYALAVLLSSFGVLHHNSDLSVIVLFLVAFAYFSFVGGPSKSPLEHFFYSVLRFFNIRQALIPLNLKGSPKGFKGALNMFRLIILPLLIFILFFTLFRAGNPIFKEWSDVFSARFWLLFEGFSWAMFWFLSLGFLLLRSFLLLERGWPKLLSDQSVIYRGEKRGGRKGINILALKQEYRMALMILVSLNVLILSVNLIDIRWFWFGFEIPKQFSLKEFLHEGVGYLIASLILAAIVVLYFFRRSLNFYPTGKGLKYLAKLWIVQNAILALSVLLRTYYYIDFHGLAYGRIVVVSALVVVGFTLVLLFLKIDRAQSTAYLIRRVSVFLMVFMAGLAVVDWGTYISRFNLEHGRINEIDVDNYLRMPERTYPLIYKNINRVEKQIKAHQTNTRTWVRYDNIEDFKKDLDFRAQIFVEKQGEQGFWSWSYADQHAAQLLTERQSH